MRDKLISIRDRFTQLFPHKPTPKSLLIVACIFAAFGVAFFVIGLKDMSELNTFRSTRGEVGKITDFQICLRSLEQDNPSAVIIRLKIKPDQAPNQNTRGNLFEVTEDQKLRLLEKNLSVCFFGSEPENEAYLAIPRDVTTQALGAISKNQILLVSSSDAAKGLFGQNLIPRSKNSSTDSENKELIY